jgi:hypothetical protein
VGDSVWILTQRLDSTADVVIEELNRRGVPVARFDLNEITVAAELTGAEWTGTLSTPTRTVSLDDAAGIYYRRPTPVTAPPGTDPEVAAWIEAEGRWGLRGLLVALPRELWINWPPAINAAEHKPHQLTIAAGCGLRVPRTAITNIPSEAAEFAAKTAPVLYKAFRGGPVHLDGHTNFTYATAVTARQCASESVALAPVMLQARIDKAFDARVTVIDDRMFAITPRAGDTVPLDWRVDHNALDWRPVEVPDTVRAGMTDFCLRMGLRFAACDFSVDHHGTWWFLEANAVGQWAWNHPLLATLTEAMVEALTGKARQS